MLRRGGGNELVFSEEPKLLNSSIYRYFENDTFQATLKYNALA